MLLLVSYALAKNVACVGNSITEGYGLNFNEDYPHQLQLLLGDNYNVQNFGVSSMTFAGLNIKGGNNSASYWGTQKFTLALNSQPDVVVIELGTNDSKYFMSHYPEKNIYNYYFEQCEKSQLYTDYKALLDTFTHIETLPEIYATLQPYSNNLEWFITDSAIVNVINPIIKETSIKNAVNIIDLHGEFNNYKWFLADSVHPNANGAIELAKIIAKYIEMPKYKIINEGNLLKTEKEFYGYYWYKDGKLIDSTKTLEIDAPGKYKVLQKIEKDLNSWMMSEEINVENIGTEAIIKKQKVVGKKLNHKVDVKGRFVK